MTQSNSSTALSSEPIGYVQESSQQLHATSVDGKTRLLSKGAPIYFGETLANDSEGTNVFLKMNDGTEIHLYHAARILLDDSLLANLTPDPVPDTASDDTQTALIDPEQITQMEPTGAGPNSTTPTGNGDNGDGGGFSFVGLSRLDGTVTPESGFETTRLSLGFPETEPDVLLQYVAVVPPTPEPPPVMEPEPLMARPDGNQISDADLLATDTQGKYVFEYQVASVQGNLLANDDAGAQLTGVSFHGNVGVLNDGVWTIADGSGIWSLTVNSTSGAYEFNLLQPFSHTLPGADTASLAFDYQIAGDVASTLTIAVVDDTPSIGWDGSLYQASVQSISTRSEEFQSVNKNTQDFEQDKGYVSFDFGADGPSQDPVVAPLRFAGIALSGDYIDFQYDGRSDNYEYAASNNFHILVSSDGQFVEGYTDSEGESDSLAFTMLLGDSGDYLFQQSSDQYIKGEDAMTFTVAAQDYEGDIASTNIIVNLNLVSDALHAQLEYQII